jgi:hypothetical protein
MYTTHLIVTELELHLHLISIELNTFSNVRQMLTEHNQTI